MLHWFSTLVIVIAIVHVLFTTEPCRGWLEYQGTRLKQYVRNILGILIGTIHQAVQTTITKHVIIPAIRLAYQHYHFYFSELIRDVNSAHMYFMLSINVEVEASIRKRVDGTEYRPAVLVNNQVLSIPLAIGRLNYNLPVPYDGSKMRSTERPMTKKGDEINILHDYPPMIPLLITAEQYGVDIISMVDILDFVD
jgi:hypothetical protein